MSMSSTPYHLENSIIDIFHQKMMENPYLHEISDYFVLRNKNIPNAKPMELNNTDIQITEVRISTKVVLCSLGIDINLDTFFKNIEPYTNLEKNYKIVITDNPMMRDRLDAFINMIPENLRKNIFNFSKYSATILNSASLFNKS